MGEGRETKMRIDKINVRHTDVLGTPVPKCNSAIMITIKHPLFYDNKNK